MVRAVELDWMRIIGGDLKGRRVAPVKGWTGRPTTDFGRESLFNLLRSRVDIEGADVLDLFAGSGMVSLEFASRGASSVTSIESDPKAVRHISQAFEQFDLGHCRAIRGDVWQFITRPIAGFDIVFADPPYQLDRLGELPSTILQGPLLHPGGLLIVEHGERTHFEDHPSFIEQRHYGQVHFSFFRHVEP